ncbi:putative telomere silencing protein [Phaeoacremonium minimum UCRPA7]|uniref:Putative telomere silencing protein n=1 Tax=Phaeoacremonium minimum (strain UCR-PA7) TaxID=1286976 RepID=R8BCZ2_PHAM7|nr:putative telomere silencing protein [Phaeoacremonium minimum UCRPA7]EON97179.1 putative telomere silencing protein [Phaeoacremonium minimum UCRPA7]
MANHPSPLPGSGSTRTDSLTFIPTFSGEERRGDRKSKGEESDSSKLSSGWKWFKSDDKDKKKKDKEKERDKEKEKEKEKEDPSKKAKGKVVDKSHENARLDVIQSSIDTVVAKGRESLLLDRESIDNKLHEERRKESSRKSSDSKKEKDGFFGSFFGGSKKKTDKESSNRKSQRALSPDPPARTLRPDVDFPYTRFPILEERAIYRMAHIKLANPKRNLLSQVLLSNFMYSYLAKIQAMHPQIQVPTSPAQKRQDEERKRKEQEQAYLEQQMQQQQQQQQQSQSNIDHYNFEYHRV